MCHPSRGRISYRRVPPVKSGNEAEVAAVAVSLARCPPPISGAVRLSQPVRPRLGLRSLSAVVYPSIQMLGSLGMPIKKTFSNQKKLFFNQKEFFTITTHFPFAIEEKKGVRKKEGRKEGRKAGGKEGRRGERGRKEGRQEGRKEGSKEGRKEGRQEGRKAGRQAGRREGRQEGRKEGSWAARKARTQAERTQGRKT